MHRILIALLFLCLGANCLASAVTATSEDLEPIPAPIKDIRSGPETPTLLPSTFSQVSAYDLTLETRLLHPYCTEMQKPPFYRVDFQQDGQIHSLFILGTCHALPHQVLPFSVLSHINQSATLISEIGIKGTASNLSTQDLIARWDLRKCFNEHGEPWIYSPSGWFNLLTHEEIKKFKTLIALYNLSDQIPWEVLDPYLAHSILMCSLLDEYHHHKILNGAATNPWYGADPMDDSITGIFNKIDKTILALEDSNITKQLELKAHRNGQPSHTLEPIEVTVGWVKWLLGASEEEIKEQCKAHYEGSAAACHPYINTEKYDETDPMEDLYHAYRDQYWIEHSLAEFTRSKSPALMLIGDGHLTRKSIPSIGRTGMLCFFQALQNSGKIWNGIQVTGIHQLVGVYPDSALTSERKEYAWVSAPDFPTEGPYLRSIIDNLPSAAP